MSHGTFYTTEKLGPKQSLTPEGFLLCEEVPLARTGMMLYGPDETPVSAGEDGVTRIFRDASQVFRAETIASAMGKSVTNDHPDDDVRPDSWKELTHGIMMNVRQGTGNMDDLLIGDLLVTTPEGIEAVQSGKREVSLGYEADYVEISPGHGKQENIIINHIALVEQGRCGPRCAIGDRKPLNLKETTTMAKKSNRILDALMKAFKAKDADEVEKLAAEVTKDDNEEGEGAVHIHMGANDDGDFVSRAEFDAMVEKNENEHAELRELISGLTKAKDAANEEAEDEAAAKKDGDTKVEDDEAVPKEAMDEFPDELKENASKAKDAAYFEDSFKDTVAMAEILAPGIRVPTFDRAEKPGLAFKRICGLRRQALDLAYVQPSTKQMIDSVLHGKALDTKNMTCDAIRILFRSTAAMRSTANNAAVSKGTSTQDQNTSKAPMTLAELNKRNAKRYAE